VKKDENRESGIVSEEESRKDGKSGRPKGGRRNKSGVVSRESGVKKDENRESGIASEEESWKVMNSKCDKKNFSLLK